MALRTDGAITDKSLVRLTTTAYLFLVSLGIEVVMRILDTLQQAHPNSFSGVVADKGVDWLVFFYPRFGGIMNFWMFLLCIFMVRFLRRYTDMEGSLKRLEEEQQYTV